MPYMNELQGDDASWADSHDSKKLRLNSKGEFVVRNKDRKRRRPAEPGEIAFKSGDMRHGFQIKQERKEKIQRVELKEFNGNIVEYDKKNRVCFSFRKKMSGSRIFGNPVVEKKPLSDKEIQKLDAGKKKLRRGKRRRGKQKLATVQLPSGRLLKCKPHLVPIVKRRIAEGVIV